MEKETGRGNKNKAKPFFPYLKFNTETQQLRMAIQRKIYKMALKVYIHPAVHITWYTAAF